MNRALSSTFSSLGKKKKGMAMTTRATPQMRKPPHHMPIQWRSLESEKSEKQLTCLLGNQIRETFLFLSSLKASKKGFSFHWLAEFLFFLPGTHVRTYCALFVVVAAVAIGFSQREVEIKYSYVLQVPGDDRRGQGL